MTVGMSADRSSVIGPTRKYRPDWSFSRILCIDFDRPQWVRIAKVALHYNANKRISVDNYSTEKLCFLRIVLILATARRSLKLRNEPKNSSSSLAARAAQLNMRALSYSHAHFAATIALLSCFVVLLASRAAVSRCLLLSVSVAEIAVVYRLLKICRRQ